MSTHCEINHIDVSMIYTVKWRKLKNGNGKTTYVISIIYGADSLLVSEVLQTEIQLRY